MNLFAIAADNAEALEKALDDLRATSTVEEASRLSRFTDRVQRDGRIGINMRQTVLNSFLTFLVHQNIYEWADKKSAVSGVPRGEILKQRLGDYYQRRVTFDGQFENGDQFRYGALNIGGFGVSRYGEYCVVLQDRVSAERSEVAYLKSDSLKTYMKAGPALHEEALFRDAAPHSRRHCLAAVKHAKDLVNFSEDYWPSLLCSEADYVEAVFAGPLALSDIEVVRMPELDYEVRFHFAFEEFRVKLSEDERALCEDFAIVWELMEQHGLSLEAVPDVPATGLGA